MQEKKTLWEGRKLVDGINCRPESVYDDFLRTKLLYHKEGGTMFYHMVQSFPAGEDVDPTAAHAAALKLAEWFQGREVLVCTHVVRDHIHSHLLVNSVSFEDGKKLHISEPELAQIRQCNDQVCAALGLPVFESQKKQRVKSMSGAEYHTTPGGMKCRDDRLHDEKYLKERMEFEFRIRQAGVHGGAAPAEYTEADAGVAFGSGGAAGLAGAVVRLGRALKRASNACCSREGYHDSSSAWGQQSPAL